MVVETAIAPYEPEEQKQITPVRRSILTISAQQVERIKLLAGMMAESQLDYRKMKSGDIFIKMMKGIEVGLEPVASMDLIDVIQGKPTLKPQGMLALAWGSGLMQSLSITDDGKICTVKMQRVGSPAHIETFSIEDAKAMGLAGKDNWKKQPAVMRKWRAVSAACRIVFPDIIQGMYIPEELSPDTIVDEGGEIVEGSYQDVSGENGNKPGTPEIKWPSSESVTWVLSAFTKDELSDTEIFKLAGVKSFDDGDGWRKYATPQEAVTAIAQALDDEIGNENLDNGNGEMVETFRYMSYFGKTSTLQFMTNEPGTDNNTCAVLYGGRGAIKKWNAELHEQLNLDQYKAIKDENIVSDFIEMAVHVPFYFVGKKHNDGEDYFEITGIEGNPVIPF